MVKKPSDKAGFFSIGAAATPTVLPGPAEGEPNLLCHLSFDDQGNGGLNVLKVQRGDDAIVRTTPKTVVTGLGAVTVVTDSEILAGLESGDGAVCIPRGTHLALPIPPALLDREGHPYTIKMTFNYRWDFLSVSASYPQWNGWLLQLPELFEGVERLLKGEPRFLFLVTLDLFSGATIGLRDGCGTGLDRLQVLIIFGLFGCFMQAGSCLAGRILVLFSVLSPFVL